MHMQNQRTLGRLRRANGQGHVMAMDNARRGKGMSGWICVYVCICVCKNGFDSLGPNECNEVTL